jgi:hypothetical protein
MTVIDLTLRHLEHLSPRAFLDGVWFGDISRSVILSELLQTPVKLLCLTFQTCTKFQRLKLHRPTSNAKI